MYIKSKAPGRICLFGEHQDYMSLSVINAAIDLRISVEGFVEHGDNISISLPDIETEINFKSGDIVYKNKKEYIKSVVNVLKKRGLFDPMDIKAVLKGNIPQRAGASSSSALVVAWAGFLLGSSFNSDEIKKMRKDIAEIAFSAEVEEFGESGGRQDQYASAFGNVNYFTFYDDIKVERLYPRLGGFVLGDSGEPKDTQKTLMRVRNAQEAGLKELSKLYKFNKNADIDFKIASSFFSRVSSGIRPYLEAVVENYDITKRALIELKKKVIDNDRIAKLMNRHHSILRDNLDISTPKIEKMINNSLEAGGLSAKINGSGEGGCMFVYCPEKEREVAEAISKAGGTPHIISISDGVEVSILENS